jgi:hypothetical protein
MKTVQYAVFTMTCMSILALSPLAVSTVNAETKANGRSAERLVPITRSVHDGRVEFSTTRNKPTEDAWVRSYGKDDFVLYIEDLQKGTTTEVKLPISVFKDSLSRLNEVYYGEKFLAMVEASNSLNILHIVDRSNGKVTQTTELPQSVNLNRLQSRGLVWINKTASEKISYLDLANGRIATIRFANVVDSIEFLTPTGAEFAVRFKNKPDTIVVANIASLQADPAFRPMEIRNLNSDVTVLNTDSVARRYVLEENKMGKTTVRSLRATGRSAEAEKFEVEFEMPVFKIYGTSVYRSDLSEDGKFLIIRYLDPKDGQLIAEKTAEIERAFNEEHKYSSYSDKSPEEISRLLRATVSIKLLNAENLATKRLIALETSPKLKERILFSHNGTFEPTIKVAKDGKAAIIVSTDRVFGIEEVTRIDLITGEQIHLTNEQLKQAASGGRLGKTSEIVPIPGTQHGYFPSPSHSILDFSTGKLSFISTPPAGGMRFNRASMTLSIEVKDPETGKPALRVVDLVKGAGAQ